MNFCCAAEFIVSTLGGIAILHVEVDQTASQLILQSQSHNLFEEIAGQEKINRWLPS
ncbi:hypothetical protein D3C84_676750 [compost metagenome]